MERSGGRLKEVVSIMDPIVVRLESHARLNLRDINCGARASAMTLELIRSIHILCRAPATVGVRRLPHSDMEADRIHRM